jgi:soluble P-type ATPase
MFELDIPGFGHINLEHLVSDFTGTLSVDGKLLAGVKDRFNQLAESLSIHVLTADTFNMANTELENINCDVRILTGDDHDLQKEEYVKKLGADCVVAFGNGNNDRKMLKAAKIGIAVCLNEGCATDAAISANIMVTSATDALDLLLNPKRLKATLRF